MCVRCDKVSSPHGHAPALCALSTLEMHLLILIIFLLFLFRFSPSQNCIRFRRFQIDGRGGYT